MLLDIQTGQSAILEVGGEDSIRSRADSALTGLQKEHLESSLVSVVLGKSWTRSPDGEPVLNPEVIYVSTNYQPRTQNLTKYYVRIPLGSVCDGVALPNPTFTDHDLAIVTSLLDDLENMKTEGHLPNLTVDCLDIFDPSTAIRQAD